jgi:membrane fusion protein (multidrug efflux system)
MLRLICVSLVIATSLLRFAAQAQDLRKPTAIAVGVVIAERKPTAKALDFVGRVEATNRVDVRARVTGYLEEVLFAEGDLVDEGAPLYQIEKGLFEAAVNQALGALERSKSAKILTEVQLKRAEELLAKSVGSVASRDQALAADGDAAGAITTAEANLATARINLGYTDITSPIKGKISKTNVTKGNVIGPNSGVLTSIVSQDPMYVSFPVSQREFLRLQEEGRQIDKSAVKCRLRFADGALYSQSGTINFVDVSVDRSTDTLLVRATFPNPTGRLVDGQLVRVTLESKKPEEKVLVPQAALIADQSGVYVFIVEDGKAAIRRLKLGGEVGPDAIVEQGLEGGEHVIVDGLQAARAGAPVTATLVPRTHGG